jgi:4-amino-4-deoxy-L-arabinose transferase-like glycosyltransferase
MNSLRKPLMYWGCLFAVLLAAKLCHLHILWAEEGYGSAAAVQILQGKMLYRDFWFDKPPLAALVYVLWQGAPGFGLRLAGAIYAFACAVATYRFANHLWGRREAWWAALLLAFFLLFDHPATVMTLAPDLLLVLPAIAAVDCAARRQAFRAGLWCSIALAVNAKAALIVAVCLAWCWPAALPLVAGLAGGTVPWLLWLLVSGALPAYWEQVWWFGAQYSRDTFIAHPLREGLLRTLNWAGFHAALVVAAVPWRTLQRAAVNFSSPSWTSRQLPAKDRQQHDKSCATSPLSWLVWLLAGFASITAGERFFPRYYFLLLAPMVLLAARGFALSKKSWRAAILCLLLVPFLRFGPRYLMLALDLIEHRSTTWADVALNDDSKQAAHLIDQSKKPKDTLLVWGYRPDLFAYTRLASASPFLDSQLLTGVIADRHLTGTHVTFPRRAAENRAHLIVERPTWIVDGLGPLNPALAITRYPELNAWLANEYERWGQTRACVIYRRKIQ